MAKYGIYTDKACTKLAKTVEAASPELAFRVHYKSGDLPLAGYVKRISNDKARKFKIDLVKSGKLD